MIQRTPYADALTYGLMIAGFLLLIGPLLVDCGICALFAVAILSVAMAVGRTRARSSL